MKIKASIITFLFMVMVASSAFAAPVTSLTETTEFNDWTSPYGGDASNMGLTFNGMWRMGDDPSGSVVGSTYATPEINYARDGGGYGPSIFFNRGATEFYFRYTAPVTVVITMEDSNAFSDPWALSYAQPYQDMFEEVGGSNNSIVYNLLDTQVDGAPEPGFGFFMSDLFQNYYTIESITFLASDPNSAPVGDVVELTSFHYNPARATPIPGAAWLLGSGLLGLVGLRRRFKA